MGILQAALRGTQESTDKQFKVLPIMISLLIGGFIGLFSETALNVALSDLMHILNVGPATVQWLTTGYLLTLGILVPVSGFLLQWFSTRQLFIASLSFSIAGTIIAALAPSFEVLMVARVIQALGTGLLLPLLFNTVLVIFPPAKRGQAMGLIGLVIMFAPAIGPTIAGLLIEKLSWNWIFWLSLPFLVIALGFGILYMQNVSTLTRPRIDLLSILLSTIGFGSVVFGFSSAGEGGWGSIQVIGFLVVGAAALLVFAIRQFKMKEPMMNLRVFKYPMFTVGVLLVLACFMVILSSMLVLPMYLQSGLALSALAAGLILLPGGVLNGMMSPIMGGLFDKYGPKWLVIPGLVFVAAALWFFSGITTASSITLIIVLHSWLMIGVSMIMMPAQTNAMNQLPYELYPHGTAVMNTLQQISGAVGTAVAVSIMSSGQMKFLKQAAHPADPANLPLALTAGIQDAFAFGMIVAIIGLIIAFFIKRVNVQKH
jgi:DHA2 family lincomycin resistance protein-like MFS transporter